MIDPGLSGKVVLITGGNSPVGIGAATTRAFAAQGAAVFVHYFRPPPTGTGDADAVDSGPADEPGERVYAALQQQSADEIVEEIRIGGGRAAAWEADLGVPE